MEQIPLIRSLFEELARDTTIPSEDRVRIQAFSDALRTPYQDQIITVLIPMLWYMRERVWAVSRASEKTISNAVSFLDTTEFVEKCMAKVDEICVAAREESVADQKAGLTQQKSGLALFLVTDRTLEMDVYPNVRSLLDIIRRKARSYHPSRDRSIVRMCQSLSNIICSLS